MKRSLLTLTLLVLALGLVGQNRGESYQTGYASFKAANYQYLKSADPRQYAGGPVAINTTYQKGDIVFRISFGDYDDDMVYLFMWDKKGNYCHYDFLPIETIDGELQTVQRIALNLIKQNLNTGE